MNVKKCTNGHFYDADKYQVCPHCGAPCEGAAPAPEQPAKAAEAPAPAAAVGHVYCVRCGKLLLSTAKFCKYCGARVPTRPASSVVPGAEKTDEAAAAAVIPEIKEAVEAPVEEVTEKVEEAVDTFETPVEEAVETVEEAAETVEETAEEAIEETEEAVETFEAPVEEVVENVEEAAEAVEAPAVIAAEAEDTAELPAEEEPEYDFDLVAGWLVCTEGIHIGESFQIIAGCNSVGRGASNTIVLSGDASVSREKHVYITYDCGSGDFCIQPGEKNGPAYLNSEIITEPTKMQARDEVRIGNGKYVFVPLCGDDFSWKDRL